MTDVAEFLTPSDRAALQRTCIRLGIAWQGWRRVPWLRTEYELLAVEAEADRIQAAERCGRIAATERAATRAGVEYDTHKKRLDRARREARYNLPPEPQGQIVLTPPAEAHSPFHPNRR